jgi:putative membrane protein
MGAADVVPGVSGGTMAFIFGIYPELLAAIKSFDVGFFRRLLTFRIKTAFEKASWQFILSLGSGILISIFSIAKGLSWLLYNHPVYIWSFFFGLILSSVITVGMDLKRWRVVDVAFFIFGTLVAYSIVGLVPAHTPNTWWFLMASGALAICAMILPGISGAFILVLLGKYHYVLEAVNHRDVVTLALVAAGACLGLLTFVRILNYLFQNYRASTIAMMAGFMLGSLRKVWPWKTTIASPENGAGVEITLVNSLPKTLDSEIIFSLAMMALGFSVVLGINFLVRKRQRT